MSGLRWPVTKAMQWRCSSQPGERGGTRYSREKRVVRGRERREGSARWKGKRRCQDKGASPRVDASPLSVWARLPRTRSSKRSPQPPAHRLQGSDSPPHSTRCGHDHPPSCSTRQPGSGPWPSPWSSHSPSSPPRPSPPPTATSPNCPTPSLTTCPRASCTLTTRPCVPSLSQTNPSCRRRLCRHATLSRVGPSSRLAAIWGAHPRVLCATLSLRWTQARSDKRGERHGAETPGAARRMGEPRHGVAPDLCRGQRAPCGAHTGARTAVRTRAR